MVLLDSLVQIARSNPHAAYLHDLSMLPFPVTRLLLKVSRNPVRVRLSTDYGAS
jgi:hypothetical protein